MENKRIYKLAITTSAVGLIMILSVMVSRSSYPDIFFRIVTPLGIILIFVSLALWSISWLLYIKANIRKKEYVRATIVAIIGLLILAKNLIRFL